MAKKQDSTALSANARPGLTSLTTSSASLPGSTRAMEAISPMESASSPVMAASTARAISTLFSGLSDVMTVEGIRRSDSTWARIMAASSLPLTKAVSPPDRSRCPSTASRNISDCI